MSNIENFIINAILVTFPLLIYEYFIVYRQSLKKEKIDILLSISLYISLYLAFYYKRYIPIEYEFISIIFPVIISYLHHKPIDALIISAFITEYSINTLDYKFYVVIPLFILFFIFYKYYSKTNRTKWYLTNISIILVSIATLLNTLIDFSPSNLMITIFSIIVYSITIVIINIAIEEANNIINLHTNLKNFEKEKDLRLSLFKITHEIKNPLAVIKGYLSMFDIKDREKSKRYLNIIDGELTRTLNLLNDFLEFTKIKIEKKETDFNKLIDDVKDVLIPFFITKNVNYYFEVEDNIIIDIDSSRIKQVILNIIKNSIEACNPSIGIVKTVIFKDNNDLIIIVKDNGEGMSKDTLDKIMTPFHTTKDYGTGLGVSLSNEIIKAHKGSLSYSSELKKGTICKIVLPLKN